MDMISAIAKGHEALGASLCKLLNSHGFIAQYADDAGAACDAALRLIEEGASVGVPGSVTVRQIGLLDALAARGSSVYTHWDPSLKPEDKAARLLKAQNADWFVMSTNALSLDEGTFVNIDGTGNRVAAMSWAPGKLLIIAGINKVTSDTASALKRVRNIATPPNVLRLGISTPCASLGHCVNCSSASRVCRVVTLMERPPIGRECHVIIVGEELGY